MVHNIRSSPLNLQSLAHELADLKEIKVFQQFDHRDFFFLPEASVVDNLVKPLRPLFPSFPQATYVLLALAWVFVPVYISSGVSLHTHTH